MEFNSKKSIRKILLFFLFLLYTQVYPFVHFHHFEDGYESSIKLSTHPIGSESIGDHNNQHKHQQHDENDLHFLGNWEYINSKPLHNIQIDFPVFFFSQLTFDHQFKEVAVFNYTEPEVIPLLFRIPPSKRAPPFLA